MLTSFVLQTSIAHIVSTKLTLHQYGHINMVCILTYQCIL